MSDEDIKYAVAFAMFLGVAFFLLLLNMKLGGGWAKFISFYSMVASIIAAIACTVGILR